MLCTVKSEEHVCPESVFQTPMDHEPNLGAIFRSQWYRAHSTWSKINKTNASPRQTACAICYLPTLTPNIHVAAIPTVLSLPLLCHSMLAPLDLPPVCPAVTA